MSNGSGAKEMTKVSRTPPVLFGVMNSGPTEGKPFVRMGHIEFAQGDFATHRFAGNLRCGLHP